jgi:hypothetical protein
VYASGYEVRILGGVEIGDGLVRIQHGTQYSIQLRNDHVTRAVATITIDGKSVGSFVLDSYCPVVIERPVNDTGRFTFYTINTSEARQAELDTVPTEKLGLIQVSFVPEIVAVLPLRVVSVPKSDIRSVTSVSSAVYDAGGTGLSGMSTQEFTSVVVNELDYSQLTIVYLRLVAPSTGIRPLSSGPVSTPVRLP